MTGNNHARLVSGMKSDGKGLLEFRINDPMSTNMTTVSPENLIQTIRSGIAEAIRTSGMDPDTQTFSLENTLSPVLHILPKH